MSHPQSHSPFKTDWRELLETRQGFPPHQNQQRSPKICNITPLVSPLLFPKLQKVPLFSALGLRPHGTFTGWGEREGRAGHGDKAFRMPHPAHTFFSFILPRLFFRSMHRRDLEDLQYMKFNLVGAGVRYDWTDGRRRTPLNGSLSRYLCSCTIRN